MRTFFLLTALALSAPVFAQGTPKSQASAPAADDDQPAVDTSSKAKAPTSGAGLGTTVITGEGESPLGLYLTPWRESRPEKDIDRPARLLQEDMRPIDKDVFGRQVEYYQALTDAAKHKGSTH
jgi:hypothetical protein